MANDFSNNGGGRCRWTGPVGLAFFLAAAFLVNLGSEVPLGSHEGLLAETTRNMVLDRPVTLADGSHPSPWLIPNFDGMMRLRKTPLPYWLAAGCAKIGGEVNEWTARLPSALAAIGTAILVAALSWRRYGRTHALLLARPAAAASRRSTTRGRHAALLRQAPASAMTTDPPHWDAARGKLERAYPPRPLRRLPLGSQNRTGRLRAAFSLRERRTPQLAPPTKLVARTCGGSRRSQLALL